MWIQVDSGAIAHTMQKEGVSFIALLLVNGFEFDSQSSTLSRHAKHLKFNACGSRYTCKNKHITEV